MYHFNIDTLSTLSSGMDTVSNTPRHPVQSIETPCPVNVDTLSSQYGHPCPSNRQEPKRTVNEPSTEPSAEDDDDFEECEPFTEESCQAMRERSKLNLDEI